MIEFVVGNIFQAQVEALVNPVNCVGIMGRGLAFEFKYTFPDNFKAYKAACNRYAVRLGKMFVVEMKPNIPIRFIINFPTKSHWRDKSKIENIKTGLIDLVQVINEKGIRSIAIPALGCGLGGLDWNIVRSLIEQELRSLENVRIIVFEPIN